MKHPRLSTTQFRVLSDEQCQHIHLAGLEILSHTGIRIADDQAVELLSENGADISDGNLVHIPPHLVEWALRNAPPRVILSDRNGQPALRLQERQVHFGTGSDCPFILDSFTGERRKFLKADATRGMRLCDALANIDFVLSMGLISDVSTAVSDIHQFDAMIRNTTKPIVFTAHDLQNCRTIVEMAEVVAGGQPASSRNPHVALFTEVVSPLQYSLETTQKLLFMANKHLPVVLSSGPMMGASGPQTHAGVLALANAEVLTGIVMAQLQRPGAPIIYAIGIHPLDMRTTVLAYGAPELSLNTAAATDMARYYELPVWGYAGCSDAKVVDQQAAMEATTSVLMSLLTGNHLVHDVGYLESGLTSSFEMVLLTDIAIEMGRSLLKPIEINDETLPLDLIHKIGAEGNYLEEDHTFDHFRDVWYSDMVDRQRYLDWTNSGSLTLGDRLNEKVKRILESHVPEPLPADIQANLAALVTRAETKQESEGHL